MQLSRSRCCDWFRTSMSHRPYPCVCVQRRRELCCGDGWIPNCTPCAKIYHNYCDLLFEEALAYSGQSVVSLVFFFGWSLSFFYYRYALPWECFKVWGSQICFASFHRSTVAPAVIPRESVASGSLRAFREKLPGFRTLPTLSIQC